MIAISPIKEEADVIRVFHERGIAYDSNCFAVRAVEDDKPVGYGLFSLVGRELTLLFVDYPASDTEICDLITRAVMNYGANRGALECDLAPGAPKKTLVALGFIPDEKASSMNIVYVFTHCTQCHHNG